MAINSATKKKIGLFAGRQVAEVMRGERHLPTEYEWLSRLIAMCPPDRREAMAKYAERRLDRHTVRRAIDLATDKWHPGWDTWRTKALAWFLDQASVRKMKFSKKKSAVTDRRTRLRLP
ncbi:hypothetical protein [uncultured Rhodoblastus sp.]|uniref:hypothetical protein n=1 Tax=uncultured Rhodoblastus sp. TaxID=543037 RepID=UPI0025FF7551|nr:hypothetical protein [uncultured Rhodoblastus sp.]